MQRRRTLLIAASLPLFALLTSCSGPTPFPTITPVPPTDTPVPATETPAPTPTATPAPAPERAAYTLNAVMDYVAKTVEVDETVTYPNHSGLPLTDMVMAVEPNYWMRG